MQIIMQINNTNSITRILMCGKQIVLLFFLSIWTFSGWAQDIQANWILKTNESGSTKNYVAVKSIKLKNEGSAGFSFKASSGQSFSAKIDPNWVCVPEDNTNPNNFVFTDFSESNTVVGSIPGSASVTPTGASTYQIPIEVPSGINGMQPKFAIGYSSQGGFGALGIGWDVSGISEISRTTQSLYYDEINGRVSTNAIQFSNEDRLSLDGQRLILLNGTHFSVNAEYGTEIENYSRLKIKTSTITNQIYFEIKTLDGNVLEYGNTLNSIQKYEPRRGYVIVFAWKLNRVTDIFGNYIEYFYSENGQYLTKVEYTGTTISTPAKSVHFFYNDNIYNPKTYFIKRFKIEKKKLLSDIITYSNNTELRRYHFGYDSENRLIDISESAQNDEILNSTTIKWGSDNLISQNNLQEKNYGPIINGKILESDNEEAVKSSIIIGDLNGDGFPDRIESWLGDKNTNGFIDCYLFDISTNNFNSTKIRIPFTYHDHELWKQQLTCGDINNDGKDEIMFVDAGILRVFKITNNTYQEINTINTNCIYHKKRNFSVFCVDINHDRYGDVVITFNNYKDLLTHVWPGYIVYYGSSQGLITPTDNSYKHFFENDSFSDYRIGDFNADGKIDYLGLNNSGCSLGAEDIYDNEISMLSSCDWGGITPPDFGNIFYNKISPEKITVDINGDGLTDMIQKVACPFALTTVYNSLYILKNTGESNTPIGTPLYPWMPENSFQFLIPDKDLNKIYTLDYNGDGTPDLILGYNISVPDLIQGHIDIEADWYFYKNINGNFVFDKKIHWNQPIPPVTSGMVMDVNRDGCMDLVIPKGPNFVVFTMSNANRRNLVHSITNGMGQTQSFTYTNYTNYNQAQTTAPIQNLKAPLVLVSSFTDIDGSIREYEYQDGKIHTEGKGFLGFSKVIVKNAIKNMKSVSDYQVENSYYGMNLTNQVISTYLGNPISTLSQNNGVKIVDAAKKRYIPVINYQISTDNLRGITSKSENITYDAYWNVTQTKTTVGNNTSITTTNTSYKSRISGGVPYLPDLVTVATQLGSEIYTRIVDYDYNTAGSLILEIKDPGDENEVKTEYSEFDNWGHATKIKVTSNNQIRLSSLKYTDSGYYIETKTNNLNETTFYKWDETFGYIEYERDHWGRITNYTYNKWGQPEKTFYPDGNRTYKTLQWAEQGNEFGAKYYSYTESSDDVPVWIWYDSLGRKICEQTLGLNGRKKSVFTEYYPDGRVKVNYQPTFDITERSEAKRFTYDEYGRVETIVTPMGEAYYSYVGKTTTVTTPEGTSETTINDIGKTIINKVNGKAVNYTYYASGLTKTSTPEGGQSINIFYDLQGNRIRLEDPDAGVIESKYDGFGKLLWEKQKIHDANQYVITTNNYDANTGLLNSISCVGNTNEITTYTYDTESGHKSRIKTVEIANQHKQTFTYDVLGRVTNVKEEIDGRIYNSGTEYYEFGKVKKETYPSGYYTVNLYDSYGNLTEVKDRYGSSIWKAIDENARGQLTEEIRGSITTTYGYDLRGLPSSIEASNIINQSYLFDSKGNLEYRKDNISNQKEIFGYDALNRLLTWDVYQNGSTTIAKHNYLTYNPSGNIESKSDLENLVMNYGEGNGKPHALTSITGKPAAIPATDLNVTYTDFKKIKTITEGIKNYVIIYGVDNQRRKSVYKINGVAQTTRYYLSDYEEEIDNASGNIKKIHYLSGGAILINDNGTESLYYGYSDYQGSLIALSDEEGKVVERYAYDPWGARRNPDNWTLPPSPQGEGSGVRCINRGYTGHEHLDAFGIINMNGRVYDPLTTMFFSPDPYVQAPGDWLNYNRYSYVLNNPLKYTDPSGNLFYALPSVSWSYYGGLSVGISAGVGLPSGLSVGAGVNYGFKNNNWTFTANTTFAGFYSYGGYDTKAGFIGGGGFGISPALTGNFGVSNNLFSVGFNYSQNGGWSASALGFSYSNQGLIFDPSITVSYNIIIESRSINFIAQEINTESDIFPAKDDPEAYRAKLFYDKDMAYEYMWKNSFYENGSPKVEIAAWILKDGKVLVLPYYLNKMTSSYTSLPGKFDFRRKSMTITINNIKYYVNTTVHTHPVNLHSKSGNIGVSDKDINHIASINRPIYILYNENIYLVHLKNRWAPESIGTWKK